MNAIFDINRSLMWLPRKSVRQKRKRRLKKRRNLRRKRLSECDKFDKVGTDNIENGIAPVYYTPLDVDSESITVSGTQAIEPEGKNIYLKL